MQDRYEAFERFDADRATFIKELMTQNSQLKAELESTKIDYEDQSTSRRTWQAKAKECGDKLREIDEHANGNPFAVVLIDGDHYVFPAELLSQGVEGGAKAARQLLVKLEDYFREVDGSRAWRFMVRIYLNMEGLLKTCRNQQVVQDEDSLRKFAVGFTQSQPLFDFIDAGRGKEKADHKIKELFNLFIKDIHCKQLIIGCCHDNGYLTALDPHKYDPVATERISLLMGRYTAEGYIGLPFATFRIDEIFGSANAATGPAAQQLNPDGDSAHSPRKGVQSRQTSTTTVSVAQPTTFSRALYPMNIYINKDDERVDESLPEPKLEDWERYNERLTQAKICNDYTLQGFCDKKPCTFAHVPDLPWGEVHAQAKRARLGACAAGSRCRSFQCMYGHICPLGDTCSRGNKCNFKKVHGNDPNPVIELAPAESSGDGAH